MALSIDKQQSIRLEQHPLFHRLRYEIGDTDTLIQLQGVEYDHEFLRLFWYVFKTHNEEALKKHPDIEYSNKVLEKYSKEYIDKVLDDENYKFVEKYFFATFISSDKKYGSLKFIPNYNHQKSINFIKFDQEFYITMQDVDTKHLNDMYIRDELYGNLVYVNFLFF